MVLQNFTKDAPKIVRFSAPGFQAAKCKLNSPGFVPKKSPASRIPSW
jgi:hypothetical protein